MIYLDHQASTPPDPRVAEAMLPWLTGMHHGNPHNTLHEYGRRARDAVEGARAEVAALIDGEAREIVFTSGATEANNLALRGTLLACIAREPARRRVVVSAVEHSCVRNTARALEREGLGERTELAVAADGTLAPSVLREALGPDCALVSVIAAQNEIGTLQPLAELAATAHAAGARFHTDAAQCAGRCAFSVREADLDLVSLSGHKLYGPQGIGALWLRSDERALEPEPMLFGGGQQRGRRGGTLPVMLCVGFGEAARLARLERARDAEHTEALSQLFLETLADAGVEFSLNGPPQGARRLPGNLSLAFAGVRATALLAVLGETLALSTGSACRVARSEAAEEEGLDEPPPSHVLEAIGLSEDEAGGVVRVSFGRHTQAGEATSGARLLADALKHGVGQ